jgi:hypothetical protein
LNTRRSKAAFPSGYLDSPDAFLDDGPTATMVRQILGAVSQLEKAALVSYTI